MINKTVDKHITGLFNFYETHPDYIMSIGEMYGLLSIVTNQLYKKINNPDK